MNDERDQEERRRRILESLRFEALAMAEAMYPDQQGAVDEFIIHQIAMALAIERGLLEDRHRQG